MALIKCPECGKEISDKVKQCIHCGFPMEKCKNIEIKYECDMEKCSYCGYANKAGVDYCSGCGKRISPYVQTKKSMVDRFTDSVYHTFGFEAGDDLARNDIKKKSCPQCGGTNFHSFVEDKIIREGKVKSTTSLNLNPFKPFTVYNHKEKIVRKPITTQVSKFVCDDCGKIFQ